MDLKQHLFSFSVGALLFLTGAWLALAEHSNWSLATLGAAFIAIASFNIQRSTKLMPAKPTTIKDQSQ